MSSVVVSDTSPLNYLVLIDLVEILPRLFSRVIIPPAVAGELSQPGTPEKVRQWIARPPAWLEQRTPQDTSSVQNLDPGETEAICLAEELGISFIIIDERKGRQAARGRGLLVAGTLALLETAAENGWINFDEAIRRLKSTPFRIHERLIQEAAARLKTKQA